MIYCGKIKDYISQKEKCILCIFYDKNEDSCWHEEWYPGLEKGRSDNDK